MTHALCAQSSLCSARGNASRGERNQVSVDGADIKRLTSPKVGPRAHGIATQPVLLTSRMRSTFATARCEQRASKWAAVKDCPAQGTRPARRLERGTTWSARPCPACRRVRRHGLLSRQVAIEFLIARKVDDTNAVHQLG